MNFEWDEQKNQSNLLKHGISFTAATMIFLDEERVDFVDSKKDYGEIRRITIGLVNGDLLTVVYTVRDGKYRIISARRAHKNEKIQYLHV